MKTNQITLSKEEHEYLLRALDFAIQHGFKVEIFSNGKCVALQG